MSFDVPVPTSIVNYLTHRPRGTNSTSKSHGPSRAHNDEFHSQMFFGKQ